jgi:hypothetical protein
VRIRAPEISAIRAIRGWYQSPLPNFLTNRADSELIINNNIDTHFEADAYFLTAPAARLVFGLI